MSVGTYKDSLIKFSDYKLTDFWLQDSKPWSYSMKNHTLYFGTNILHNPLTPMSNQDKISPYNNNTTSTR